MADYATFEKKFPTCHKVIEPMMAGIFQLKEYYKTLTQEDPYVKAFRTTVQKFKDMYINDILVKNVGTEEASKVNFNDLPRYLMEMITKKEASIMTIH